MGYGGSTAEIGRTRQDSAWLLSLYGRRIGLGLWCGVIFCTAVLGCGSPPRPATQDSNTLTIGFAEGGLASERLGQLTTIFSLEGLTQLGVDGRPLPRLARSWTWENGFLRLRLHLQPRVTFHDGTPLSARVAADALREAIERNRAFYPSFSDVTSVTPDGEGQLVLELSQPSAFLPEALDLPLGIGSSNVGTGPF